MPTAEPQGPRFVEPALKNAEYDIVVPSYGIHTTVRKDLHGDPDKKAMLCNSWCRDNATKALLRFSQIAP
jgi:hypothetical protein